MRHRVTILFYLFLLTLFFLPAKRGLALQISNKPVDLKKAKTSGKAARKLLCDQAPGADMGAKITRCLSTTGGMADASNFPGAQRSADSITISKPVVLKLGPAGASLTLAPGKQIVVSSSSVTIQCAPGFTIIQGAAGTNLISVRGFNDFAIKGCKLQGTPGPRLASSNDAIHIVSANHIRVENNKIMGFQQNAAYTEDSRDVWYVKNEITNNSGSLRFCGVRHGFILQNTVRDPQIPNNVFTIAIAVDSRGSSCPTAQNSRDIHVEGNMVRHFVNAQAIDFHDCTHCTATGNIMNDILIGISANPFQSGDTASDLTIANNIYEGTLTPGAASTTANSCIVLGGGPDALRITHATIRGNTCNHANAVVHSDIQGGITVGYADDIIIMGNVIRNSVGAGISLHQTNTHVLITKNRIMDTILCCGSQQFGIYSQAAQTGRIEDNLVDGANQGNKGTAYRFDAASPGLLFGNNDARNIENKLKGGNNVTMQKD